MKTHSTIPALVALGILLGSLFSCSPKTEVLEGKSQSVYTNEPYVGKVSITISGEKISDVKFEIIDTLNNELFGSDYDKHYPNNDLYRQQCRNDWQGVLNYPKQLLQQQDISKVDAISGATWSFRLFKAATEEALKGRSATNKPS